MALTQKGIMVGLDLGEVLVRRENNINALEGPNAITRAFGVDKEAVDAALAQLKPSLTKGTRRR
jgi:hypothetical protein